MAKKTINIIFIFIYRLTIDVIYNIYISRYFDYSGFSNNFNLSYYFLSLVILLIFTSFVISYITNKKMLSTQLFMILYLVSFVPFTSMLGFDALQTNYYYANFLYWFLLIFFYRIFNNLYFFKQNKINGILDQYVIWLIGAFSLIVVLFISWRYTGFRITFDLLDVYSFRGNVISNLPSLINYIYLATSAINPILLSYSLSKKNYLLSAFIILVQLLSFGINGSKSIFFMTLLAIIIHFLFENKNNFVLIRVFMYLSIISLLEYIVVNSSFFIDFIIRRLLYVPNLINNFYFDFFTSNSPDYFRQSIFGNSEYSRISTLIGYYYMGDGNMAANSGLISDAFQNLGWFGIFIFPLILVLLFKLLDNLSINLDNRIILTSSIYISNVLISATLTTSLLTHGLLALMFILFLLPRENQSNRLERDFKR